MENSKMTLKFIFPHKTPREAAEEIMSKYGSVTVHTYNEDSVQGARKLAYAIIDVNTEVLEKLNNDDTIEIELMPDLSNTCRRKSGSGCGCA